MTRWLPSIAALAALAACSDQGPGGVSGAALFRSLGPYSVQPIGTPPGGGSLTVTDVNDSGVVVGSVGLSAGSSSYAFRWTNGAFQALQSSGNRATAYGINNKGDVVGISAVSTVWLAGSTQPIAIAPPESTTYSQASPLDITNDGKILLRLGQSAVALVGHSPFVRIRSIGGVTSAPVINGEGLVAFVDELANFYPPMRFWDLVNDGVCSMGGHGSTRPVALNDQGEVLYSSVITVPASPEAYRLARHVAGTALSPVPCADLGTVAPFVHGLRMMNNQHVLAGVIEGVASVGIMGNPDFVAIDDILKRSGNGAESWHVTDVQRLTNTGIFLATAQRSGSDPQPVLLVPVGR